MTTTIFTGKQATGKTTEAIKISETKTSLWLTSILDFDVKQIDDSVDLIVIDDVHFNGSNSESILTLINAKTFTYRKPYAISPLTIPAPDLLLITNTPIDQIPKEILDNSTVKFFN